MKTWLKWVILGILSIACGGIALGNTVAASIAVTTLTGILFLVVGAIQVTAGFGEIKTANKVFTIGMGALALFIGVSFLFNPLEGAISLALLVMILLAIGGVARLVLAWTMKASPYFWPMLISGALSILLAGYILANWSAVALQLMGILLGVELIVNGISFVILGLFLRSHPKQGQAPSK